jgi:competence ComEA-like helix-hairpin-helix protein
MGRRLGRIGSPACKNAALRITMSTQPTPAPAPAPPAAENKILAAWPRSAQLTTAFLLGVALTLLVIQLVSYTRFGSRPAQLDHYYRVDLNRADRAELLQLPGIGITLVDRVEEYRRDHGGFRSVDELSSVRGIGPTTLERLRPLVYVSANEDASDPVPAMAVGKRASKPGKKETALKEPIDINRASAADLQRLPGIGSKMSQRILDERQKKPFKTVEELRRVSGIGPKTLEKLRRYVTVTRPSVELAQDEN